MRFEEIIVHFSKNIGKVVTKSLCKNVSEERKKGKMD